MREKGKILKDFRKIIAQLQTGELARDTAAELTKLVDEFSALGLGSNVHNNAEGEFAGQVLQTGDIGDPYGALRQIITYLRTSSPSPEKIAALAPRLSAAVDKLAQMTSGGSVS